MDFFNLEHTSGTSILNNEDYEKKEKSEKYTIEQANLYAKIPLRFKYSRLSDYHNSFTKEGKLFCLDDNSDKFFMISGSTGSGKSSFLTGMSHERAVNGKYAGLYITGRTVTIMIKASRSFSAKENEMELYERLSKIPFLIYDEIGTSDDVELERSFFRNISALRFDNKLSWCGGTNLNAGDFKKFICGNNDPNTDPIMDRMKSIMIFKTLVSESHR